MRGLCPSDFPHLQCLLLLLLLGFLGGSAAVSAFEEWTGNYGKERPESLLLCPFAFFFFSQTLGDGNSKGRQN